MAAVSRTPSNSSFYPDEEEISRNSSSSRLFLSWNFRGFYSSCHARKVILTRGFNLLRFLMRLETFRQIITSAIHLWFFLRLRKNIFLIRGWTRNTYDPLLYRFSFEEPRTFIGICDSSNRNNNFNSRLFLPKMQKTCPLCIFAQHFFQYKLRNLLHHERWFQQRLE